LRLELVCHHSPCVTERYCNSCISAARYTHFWVGLFNILSRKSPGTPDELDAIILDS
jgi:hypothetical protein